jgi:hypothetical protein
MGSFIAAETTGITGPTLLVFAEIAADMGLRNSALAYIDRAYLAFDLAVFAPHPADMNRSRIHLATLDGQAVQD